MNKYASILHPPSAVGIAVRIYNTSAKFREQKSISLLLHVGERTAFFDY